jgi:RHS repeat-associated protein
LVTFDLPSVAQTGNRSVAELGDCKEPISPLAAVLLQATDYYPFGKSFENKNVTKNRYLYNRKKLQDQVIGGTQFGWYDYGARFYDPELGVFHTMDPLAERFSFQSPFAYAANNPIIYIDKDGKGPLLGFLIGAGAEYGVQVIKNFRSGHGWNSFGHIYLIQKLLLQD